MDIDEKSHHQAVTEAMRVIGFSPEEVASVHRILAAILHLVSLPVGTAATSPCGAWLGTSPEGEDWPLTTQQCNWPSPASAETQVVLIMGSHNVPGPRLVV